MGQECFLEAVCVQHISVESSFHHRADFAAACSRGEIQRDALITGKELSRFRAGCRATFSLYLCCFSLFSSLQTSAVATSELLVLCIAVVPLSPVLEEILPAALYKSCPRSALMGQELIQAPLVYWHRDGVAAFQRITVSIQEKAGGSCIQPAL